MLPDIIRMSRASFDIYTKFAKDADSLSSFLKNERILGEIKVTDKEGRDIGHLEVFATGYNQNSHSAWYVPGY